MRQDRNNNENQLTIFYDSIWQDCTDTNRSTREYIVLYWGGPIDHFKHVTGLFAQSSVENEYNASCTAGMALKDS